MSRRVAFLLLIAFLAGCGGKERPPTGLIAPGGQFTLRGRAEIQYTPVLDFIRPAERFPVRATGTCSRRWLRVHGAVANLSGRFVLSGERFRAARELLQQGSWTPHGNHRGLLELALSREALEQLGPYALPAAVQGVRVEVEVAYRPGVNRGRS